jgi:hypothetical protein
MSDMSHGTNDPIPVDPNAIPTIADSTLGMASEQTWIGPNQYVSRNPGTGATFLVTTDDDGSPLAGPPQFIGYFGPNAQLETALEPQLGASFVERDANGIVVNAVQVSSGDWNTNTITPFDIPGEWGEGALEVAVGVGTHMASEIIGESLPVYQPAETTGQTSIIPGTTNTASDQSGSGGTVADMPSYAPSDAGTAVPPTLVGTPDPVGGTNVAAQSDAGTAVPPTLVGTPDPVGGTNVEEQQPMNVINSTPTTTATPLSAGGDSVQPSTSWTVETPSPTSDPVQTPDPTQPSTSSTVVTPSPTSDPVQTPDPAEASAPSPAPEAPAISDATQPSPAPEPQNIDTCPVEAEPAYDPFDLGDMTDTGF